MIPQVYIDSDFGRNLEDHQGQNNIHRPRKKIYTYSYTLDRA